jgi:hypothetical protein
MPRDINLKELERRAWRSVFQDGLWDIYLGLLLMAMAILTLLAKTDLSQVQIYTIYLGLMVLAMLVLWAGKRVITIPRLGRVKFGPKGRARKKKARIILAISVLVGLVLFVFTWLAFKGDWDEGLPLQYIIPAVWAVNMLTVFSMGAYFLDFDRLYLIGVLYALPVPVDFLLRELTGVRLGFVVFAVPAAVILIIGVTTFVRFLREYPKPVEENQLAERALRGNH